ncbi:MAG: hypothetical protein F6K42_24145 [Leptolyngbya sp. SIO1D8]|nr:hypothetical protein [Leptolyngbya sp. SIO1D8]
MIQSVEQMIDRDWIKDPTWGYPPGFFFPTFVRPHLHVISLFDNNQIEVPWRLGYLGFTDVNGYQMVIYQCTMEGKSPEVDDPEKITYLAANLQSEAHWAYELK